VAAVLSIDTTTSQRLAEAGRGKFHGTGPRRNALGEPDIGPLINLGMQHDRRSARTWMKRVFTTFLSLWEGEKDLLESTKMDFYET